MFLRPFFLIACGIVYAYRPSFLTENGPSVILNDSSLSWGPYRPNLYVGMRPRVPESVSMGLMWSRAEVEGDSIVVDIDNLRHNCEQDKNILYYGWRNYDARTGGVHVVNDTGNQLDLTTSFVRGGDSNHDWALRVNGTLRHDAHPGQKTVLAFYVANEAQPDRDSRIDPYLVCSRLRQSIPPVVYTDAILGRCQGFKIKGGDFKLWIVLGHQYNHKRPTNIIHTSFEMAPDALWQAKDIFVEHLRSNSGVPQDTSRHSRNANLHFMQLVFEGDFVFDILFHTADDHVSHIDTWRVPKQIEKMHVDFEERHEMVYTPLAPFAAGEYREFSRALLSDLMGGIGYFYGKSIVEDSRPEKGENGDTHQSSLREEGPQELFSAVPSRSFFPRGFLWDEGFHLQLVVDWDLDLAVEIFRSWLGLIDDDGWIAREQILGPEARSRVPKEFQPQHKDYANPPTMFVVAQMLKDRLTGKVRYRGTPSQHLGNKIASKTLLQYIYRKLSFNYNWFRRTQGKNISQFQHQLNATKPCTESYQWRGRTLSHILPSGLDDYPRGQPLREGDLHVDALSWVGMMAKILRDMAAQLGQAADEATFSNQRNEVLRSLDELHWSSEHQAYCDVTLNLASDDNDDDGDNIDKPQDKVYHCYKGYVSLLPIATKLIDLHHPNLWHILQQIHDPELWTPFGIRSLSDRNVPGGLQENYCRGPIWININYMILERLSDLIIEGNQEKTPNSDDSISTTQQHVLFMSKYFIPKIYAQLRQNLVDTVYKSWRETGFAWEQYNPSTGRGQRTRGFTGWTALVVKIMAMPANLTTVVPLEQEEENTNRRVSYFHHITKPHNWTWSSCLMFATLVTLAFYLLFCRRRRGRRLGMLWSRIEPLKK